MATDVPAYAEETWVPDAAPGISAAQLQRIDDQIRALTDEFNIHNGGDSVLDHPVATTGVIGFMSGGDKLKADGIGVAHAASNDHPVATGGVKGMMSAAQFNKLGGIETGATQDQTPAQHLADIKTVDGAGSGLDADLLDGQNASAFLGVGAKAADSNLLDGINSTSFVRDTGNETIAGIKTFSGQVVGPAGSVGAPGFVNASGGFGIYRNGIYEGMVASGADVIVGDGIDETYFAGVPVGGGVGVLISGTQMFRVSSARRLKKNITEAGPDYLGLIDLVAAHTFDWRKEASPDRNHQYGHIADDIEEACISLDLDPDLFVVYGEDNPKVPDFEDENPPEVETRIQDRKDRALLSLALDAISDLRERVSELEGALA